MLRVHKNKIEIKKSLNPKIGMVVSGYHEDITSRLKNGAIGELLANSVPQENIREVAVPGSFEIPLALERMADSGEYDALIGVGCVIKGKTDHYYFISSEVSRGIMRVMLDYKIPIGFCLLTTDTLEQAWVRSRGKNNKGAEAARAILSMIIERKFIKRQRPRSRLFL